MLGYMSDNRDYFKGNVLEYNLKKAVTFSGGTEAHYNYFKAILSYSIFNLDTKTPLHDAKAGEFTLHLFPLKIQAILSILFYEYELDLLNEYSNQQLQSNDVLLPSQQITYSNIITGNAISNDLLFLIDDIGSTKDLSILKTYLCLDNLEIPYSSLLVKVKYVLEYFNLSQQAISDYFVILKSNDRLKSMLLSAQALNYRPQSYQFLTEALSTWHQTSSI